MINLEVGCPVKIGVCALHGNEKALFPSDVLAPARRRSGADATLCPSLLIGAKELSSPDGKLPKVVGPRSMVKTFDCILREPMIP